jgi:transcriptional regulator with XRE-family HTH domain
VPATDWKRGNFAERFDRNLGEARQATGLSQEDLGMRAGLHRTAVGQLERGQRIARLDTYVKLIDSLGLAPGDLLDGLSWRPAEFTEGEWSASDAATL